jgi:hypothetical protein
MTSSTKRTADPSYALWRSVGRLHLRRLGLLLATALASLAAVPAVGHAADPCSAPVNAIACENSKPGTDPIDWQVLGSGDDTIQGFATSMSVNVGQTVSFKVKTSGSNYHIDILRLGYYQGKGARKIATISSPTSRTQPTCLTAPATGLIDCGNWGVSGSWAVPSTAVSGVYIAHLVRNDNGADSQIPFVVRDDASHSKVLLQTSDATWQAYNTYGGNSLYKCTVACPPGDPLAYKAAYAVSYNRPIDSAGEPSHSYLYHAEYQMIRWLERQGYDVSYTSEADVDANGPLLQNHQMFMSSGHDEYWSKGQRDNVEAARNAGVNLAFFSGNEVFWKTRWANSSDGSNTPRRTLISYKETHFDSPVDPATPTWTGTWADPRFSPPTDGGKPQNALTGQFFTINTGTSDIKVPGKYAPLRFWRNTAVANLTSNQTLTLSPNAGTLGYEWDEDLDNGSRPAGLFQLSSTTVSGLEKFQDYGSTTAINQTATHHLTLYRAPSGALVFGAGTVQWSWGLDNTNAWGVPSTDPSGNPPDPNIQQATVNLFADMGAQPFALSSGLTVANKSTDTTAPTATVSSPASGATLQDGVTNTISGTASDVGGVVAGVEVSTDGGSTWHPATGTTSWTYSWQVHGSPSTTIKVRAVDDSANLGSASTGTPINVSCSCSLWGNQTPPTTDSGDTTSVEVGVKFKTDKFGTINGIRFYKSAANTGTHIGSLWSADGTRLAQATFSGESGSGWQQVTFPSPVSVLPDTTYIASYFAPAGHYAASSGWFYVPSPTGGNSIDSPPLHAISANGNGTNGLYLYTASSAVPTQSYGASNYWVDVMFTPSSAPGQVTNVNATAGPGQAHLTWTAPSSGGAVTSYKITPFIGSTAQTPTTINGTPPATSADVSGLTGGQTYTFTVQAINPIGNGTVSAPSNPVTPTVPTAPTAPSNVVASAASGSALVNWSAPSSNGGGAITGYTVTPYIGATAQTPVSVPASPTSKLITGLTNDTSYTFKVTATNSIGTGPASGASNAVTPRNTIFNWATPSMIDSNDNNAVVLGVKFKADASGLVTGVRFYKSTANTGTHIGSLWSAGGQKLAEATFTNETASGWQQVEFASPVLITAGTTYVAAYLAPNGRYSATSPGLTSAIDNPPLHAISNTVDANGVYRYNATNIFPSSSFNASNYFVDVMFTAVTTPGKVTDVAATAGSGSANVTWSAPGGGPVTSYKITPYIGTTAQTVTTITGSPPATSATISGLTGGQTYTFRVQAFNSDGSGQISDPSNAVTPTGASAPTAPTSVSATGASSSARVSWNPPADDGGRAITGYTVTPFIGSTAGTAVSTTNTALTITGLTNGTSYTFKVTATNAIGTGPAATSNATTPLNTIFDFTAPAIVDAADPGSVELGVKFKSDVAGTVTGVRFYKAAANTGTHIGGLWTSTGTALSSATFSGESASGWQAVNFATPVAITAGTTYVAGYFAPNGHYSVGSGGLGPAVDNPPLHTIPNGISANGVYDYGFVSVFPTSSYNQSNYYVDVMFQPGS